MQKINWGVLSCAKIAKKSVIPAILAAENANLYAIAGRDTNKLDEFNNLFKPQKIYNSYDKLLDDPSVDAVYIPLPNSMHSEWAIKAAKKNKHLLCEKPMALTEQELLKMIDVAKENKVLLVEAFAYLHAQLVTMVRAVINDGMIGQVRCIESHFSYCLADRANVRFDLSLGGGAAYDIGCYPISFVRSVLGKEPITISPILGIDKASGIDINGTVAMDFGDEKAMIYFAFDSYASSYHTIWGTNGMINIPIAYNKEGECKFTVKTQNNPDEIVGYLEQDNYMLEIKHMSDCIMGKAKPVVTWEFSKGNARVLDEVLKARIENK